jgi:hypothetical protein
MWTEQEIRNRLIITEDLTTGQKRMVIIDGPKHQKVIPEFNWATFVPAICVVALMLGVEVFVQCVVVQPMTEHTRHQAHQH